MKISRFITPFIQRNAATVLLLATSLAAFATLGEGGKKDLPRAKNLLSARLATVNFKNFTLRSGYDYRGSKLLGGNIPANNYIMLNNVITVEKGNQTFIVPMRRKVLLEHVTFKPGANR